MEIVRRIDAPFRPRPDQPREGRFEFSRLLEGEPGRPDNFLLQLSRTWGDYRSPRHRHNFDQIRYMLEGTFNFGRDGKLPPGNVMYVPEGTIYGPQTSDEDTRTLVLQFSGASGSGYVSEASRAAAVAALSERGSFREGVYYPDDETAGLRRCDASEAVWYHVHGRRPRFPKRRFERPMLMNPENYDWIASDTEGVWEKLLGVFGERRTRIGFYLLEPGAFLQARGRGIFYVLGGEGVAGERLVMVERGVLNHWFLSTSAASELGLETNGRGVRASSSVAPSSTNLAIEPGDSSPQALIGALKSGFYVTEVFGQGVDMVTGDYSRGASGFWIDNGELAFPVAEVTIAANLKDMFMNMVPADDLDRDFGTAAPTLLIEGMTLAGD